LEIEWTLPPPDNNDKYSFLANCQEKKTVKSSKSGMVAVGAN
jgi:hypothetical protein